MVESGGNKSKSANLKATQTFEVELHEAEQLQKHFNFKNKKPLLRELRENEIAHALKSHGDETKESQRGNIAITRADIEANYPRITQEYDEQFFTDKSVIYVKQIKGNYNKEVLLKNAKANPYPHNADEVAKSESISNPSLEQGYPQQYHLSNTNSTTNNLKWQQDGNVLRSVVELDNGEKLLLSKDRLENIYIQSNHIEQVNSYDELILQESLEKFAKDELENKLAKQIESKGDSSSDSTRELSTKRLDSDSKGNFLITAKKVNITELDNPKYKKLARAGVEPATTTPQKEQKPTEAISLARDDIIPQMPKDNSDPVKTFEYFRDDFIKEYPKALEFYSGQIPLASELSYGVEKSLLNEIKTIKEAMNNTAKDKFKELLKNIGLKQNEIAQVLDTTIRSDIDFTLDRVRDYLDYVARNLENFPPEHKHIAQEILAHSQNILNIFENKTPQIEQLQKKRELITSFHNNATTSNTKEQDLLKGLINELYKPQSKQTPQTLESTPPKDTQTPPTSKGLFDEVDSSEAPPSKINFTYTTGEAKGIAELRKDLKQALEPSLNKEIVNKEQGLSGVITTEEVKKIMSKKAVDKSIVNGFTRDEHIEVAKHIERLFTESKLLRSHKDYKENPNILQVHRFVKDIEVNGKEANALITLFEKMQGKNKIYTIELESLENLPPLSTQAKSAETAVKAQSAAATPTEAAPIAKTDTDIIPQTTLESTMQKFNYDERKAKDLLEWHKDSSPLTKDENGVPKAENMLESKAKTQGQRVDIEIPKEKDFFKNLRNNTKKVLSVLKGQVFENINSGMKAQVSSDGINKMISVKAVDKSINNGYTKEEHFASVENVINLYKISKLTQSEKPNNNSVDVIAYHKFIADFSINHKPTKAKITLRETFETGNRIYSLELLELEKASN